MEKQLNIWGERVPRDIFSEEELDYLLSFADTPLPSLEQIWQEMDRVWDNFDLDNRVPLEKQKTAAFYSHPVWILNAFYTGADPVSVGHRRSIAQYVGTLNPKRVADYGGGGAELARNLSSAVSDAVIDIVEPFPTSLGKYRVHDLKNVHFVDDLNGAYDVIIAQDVLEHVEHPISIAEVIAAALRPGGIAIFANCFRPVIKCHLPRTFHLRNSFRHIVKLGGLDHIGAVRGAGHVEIYSKKGDGKNFHLSVSVAEKLSYLANPFIEFAVQLVRLAARMVRAKR
jgi:2-polyprenyl-3-methyl-5-hydroxy-6-metoxy-1,4-benzoquinol methylase